MYVIALKIKSAASHNATMAFVSQVILTVVWKIFVWIYFVVKYFRVNNFRGLSLPTKIF